jgi:hypothetical protein
LEGQHPGQQQQQHRNGHIHKNITKPNANERTNTTIPIKLAFIKLRPPGMSEFVNLPNNMLLDLIELVPVYPDSFVYGTAVRSGGTHIGLGV